MFGDFDSKRRAEEGTGRRTVSLVLAGGVFVLLALGIGAAVATAHVREIARRDLDVEFAPAPEAPEPEPEPEPEPPPPPPPTPARPRPAAARDSAPTAIPDARPSEAEGDLADPGDVGPVDGVVGGVEGGEGRGRAEVVDEPVAPPPPPPPREPRPPRPPPQQERVEVQPPTRIGGCDTPERPDTLEGATAETIRIRVRVVVSEDGTVMRATVTEGHPLVPDETVLSCVRTRLYEPATLEGRPVPFVFTYVFTFRPDVL